MKNCVIVAEYNPFHNGHLWQIQQARKLGAKTVTVIMSGNFVQRGTPALFPKQCRASAALCCGADLVIELPVPYAISSAEKFASSAIHLANSLNFIDSIMFGAENPDVEVLIKLAQTLLSPECDQAIKAQLIDGVSYPVARGLACEFLMPGSANILTQPNNILAIEYCKALISTNSDIVPYPMPRMGSNHHDTTPNKEYASASFLRTLSTENWQTLVPARAQVLYRAETMRGNIVEQKRFETAALSRLRCASSTSIAMLPDVSEGLENAIYNSIQKAASLEAVYSGAKSKRYTHSRIRRIVLCSVLGISKALPSLPPYIRVLGATTNGFDVLGEHKKKIKLPYSHSISVLEKENIDCAAVASAEIRAGDFYSLCLTAPLPCGSEYEFQIIKA